MREDRVYRIRQAILRHFLDVCNSPCYIRDLLLADMLIAEAVGIDEAVSQVNDMVAEGYLEFIPESGNRLVRMTAKGRSQINREGKRDFFIWGKSATLLAFLACLLFVAGCRTNNIHHVEYYESGQVKSEYTDTGSGFIEWSSGDGKTLSFLNPQFNGVGVGK